MKDTIFYKIVRPILSLFIKIFRPTIINKDNIPKEKRVLLVGNHTNYLDCLLLISSTKRSIHFFAKDSLYRGLKKPIFKGMGIIPVNRTKKDKNSLKIGEMALKNELVVCIFPEGTINRTNDILMPFKYGSVKLASLTNTPIVPFSITGKYKLFRKSVKIEFGKPYFVSNDLEKENNLLMDKVTKLIKKEVEK